MGGCIREDKLGSTDLTPWSDENQIQMAKMMRKFRTFKIIMIIKMKMELILEMK